MPDKEVEATLPMSVTGAYLTNFIRNNPMERVVEIMAHVVPSLTVSDIMMVLDRKLSIVGDSQAGLRLLHL